MKAWRINLILLFLFLFGAVIICRLFYIQVSKHEYWKALAKGQQMLFSDIPANRGEIYLRDKNGKLYPLAVNKEWPLVYVVPNEILAKEETAQKLSDILGVE